MVGDVRWPPLVSAVLLLFASQNVGNSFSNPDDVLPKINGVRSKETKIEFTRPTSVCKDSRTLKKCSIQLT